MWIFLINCSFVSELVLNKLVNQFQIFSKNPWVSSAVGNFIASLSVASTITLSPKRSSLVVSSIPKSLSLLLNKPLNQSPIPVNHSFIESIKFDGTF